VGYVLIALIIMFIAAFRAENGLHYYLITLLGMACYPLSHYFHNSGQEYMGTLMHSYIHILGNIGLFVIFSGEIPWLLGELTDHKEASTDL
jgi:hypothetical protein